MSYPASPPEAGPNRAQLDTAQYWAGAAATAVVAALIGVVGILIARWTLKIPILAPAGDGAFGNAHTPEYALLSALIAIIAAGLLYLLVLGTPQPYMFFGWIIALATLAAVVYPFSTSAPLDQKTATAIVNLVIGVAIGTLLTAVARRATSRTETRPPYMFEVVNEPRRGVTGYPGYHREAERHALRQALQEAERRGQPQPGDTNPTQPIDVPRAREPRPLGEYEPRDAGGVDPRRPWGE